jgi:hypothetical protein
VTLTGAPSVRARYLIGCDGGRSLVRKLGGFDFPGTAPMLVTRAGQVRLANVDTLPPPGRYPLGSLGHGVDSHGVGLLGVTEFEGWPEDRDTPLTVDELTDAVRRVCGVTLEIEELTEPRRVLDNARQVSEYRRGRVLLAGDAAHVHSPNGGQGLSLGLMDAANLAWKLAYELHGLRLPLAAGQLSRRTPPGRGLGAAQHPRAVSAARTRAAGGCVARHRRRPDGHPRGEHLLLGATGRAAAPLPAALLGGIPSAARRAPAGLLGGYPRRRYELTRDGCALALLAPDAHAQEVVDSARVRVVTLRTPLRPPRYPELAGAFVRPDEVLASSDEPGSASLSTALAAWYGPATA